MDLELEARTALVIGAPSGLGLGSAAALRDEGAGRQFASPSATSLSRTQSGQASGVT